MSETIDNNVVSKEIKMLELETELSSIMESVNPYCLFALADWAEADALGLKRGAEFHPCRLVAAYMYPVREHYQEVRIVRVGND